MTDTTYTAWACTDCHLTAAGYSADELGYAPDREPLALIAEHDITHGLVPAEHATDCAVYVTGDWDATDCECDHDSFSLQSCDGCGSGLAGDRYALTVTEHGYVGRV